MLVIATFLKIRECRFMIKIPLASRRKRTAVCAIVEERPFKGRVEP